MGYLVTIEGIDGSGKGTQAKRLLERLEGEGRRAKLLSFPRYDATFFGRAVGEYLNGAFGSLGQVHPFFASLLFAGDRFESRTLLTEALGSHEVVVLDRYVASNIAHQAARLDGVGRERLVEAIEHLEFDVYEMPRPDLNVLLDLSVPCAQRLIASKPARNYTERAADIQEADANYLTRVRALYLELARREPNWSVVYCEQQGSLRSVDEIAAEIASLVKGRATS
ncbi:MAG TPA: thymidylate kinase [Planctomycetaceae bacterium]|nr:thymidylate kinase [Planctomycetaceae bacterium]